MYIQPNITHFTILFTFIAFSDSFSIFLFSYRDASFFLLFYIVLILFFHSTDFDEFPSFTLLSSPLIPLLNSFFQVFFLFFSGPFCPYSMLTNGLTSLSNIFSSLLFFSLLFFSLSFCRWIVYPQIIFFLLFYPLLLSSILFSPPLLLFIFFLLYYPHRLSLSFFPLPS